MSADAKIWTDDEGAWHGIHDGKCLMGDGNVAHKGMHTAYDLRHLIVGIERCMCVNGGRDCSMRWEFGLYPNDEIGLRGFIS